MKYLAAVVLAGGCGMSSASTTVGPNEDVRLTNGVNGDVSCDRGTIYLPPNAIINGDLDSSYCVLKIEGTVNGTITATGGMVHVIGVSTVNGRLDVSDALELVAIDSEFNGGADIENVKNVEVTGCFFNGSVEIKGSTTCTQSGNQANGSLVASNCL